jgi:hypothetical protein
LRRQVRLISRSSPVGGERDARPQEQLLDVAARLVIGPDARAEDLVRAIFEDFRRRDRPCSEDDMATLTPAPHELDSFQARAVVRPTV